MVHRTQFINFIGADESVYNDSSPEKLVSRFRSDLSMEQFAIKDFTPVPGNLISCINGNGVAISSIIGLEDSFKSRGGQAIPLSNEFDSLLACR
jgi:hypothetical protein